MLILGVIYMLILEGGSSRNIHIGKFTNLSIMVAPLLLILVFSFFTNLAVTTTLPPLHSFFSPFHLDRRAQQINPETMPLMLRDAMSKLDNNGFTILSRAMKEKYADLVALNNITIFAIEDVAILSGSQAYVSRVGFHIVPNQFLRMADLERLPVGTMLPTLERGQWLVVTTGGIGTTEIRINDVRVKVHDFIRNLEIVVHSVYSPFSRIYPPATVYDAATTDEHDEVSVPDQPGD